MSAQPRGVRLRPAARTFTVVRVSVALIMVGAGVLVGAGGWHGTARADNGNPIFTRPGGGSSATPTQSQTSATVPTSAGNTGATPVTVRGTGKFSSLSITVSQTTSLIDQVVRVTWSGGQPTDPPTGDFNSNYLQIMQCWGDDPTGPRRDQCQFGGHTGDNRGGAFASSREVTATPKDPLETIPDPGSGANVPFTPVTGDPPVIDPKDNQFFDGQTTNEISFARTGADGTGQAFVEVQTSREAPGLGCGEALSSPDGTVTGRSCWLVVVPRGDTEVDGTNVVNFPGHKLSSSPLAATNWANRIAVPLEFQPIGRACPIGAAERKTFGQEQVSQAMRSWQPTLCGVTGAVFGYSQVSDDLARAQLATTDPGFAFVSKPVDAAATASPVVYAPLALSGVAIAFNIDIQTFTAAPPAVKARNGQRITDLNLTPRLVAKLLTQTYSCAIHCRQDYLVKNPVDLTTDPDFLAINPAFKDYGGLQISDLLAPLGDSDMATQIWSWIDADPEAHAFMAGQPDPWGTKINPAYLGMQLPVSNFPKSDLFCVPQPGTTPENQLPCVGEFDRRPYANDMQSAARAASRGDSLAVDNWDPTATPPAFKREPLQLSGDQELLAIADTATALRFSLPVAKLRNSAGEFVAPTTESLTAGVQATNQTESGVLVPSPTKVIPGSYPLTVLSYGATSPAGLGSAGRHDYAAFIDYAVTAGQQPGLQFGQLPPGYVPLPDTLRVQSAAVAKALGKRPGVELSAPAAPVAPATAPPPAKPGSGGGGGPIRSNPRVIAPSAAAASTTATVVTHTAAPQSSAPAAVSLSYTPVQSVGIGREALMTALILGGLCALAGPALIRTAIRAGR